MDSVSTRPAVATAPAVPIYEQKQEAVKTELNPSKAVQSAERTEIQSDVVKARVVESLRPEQSAANANERPVETDAPSANDSFKSDSSVERKANPSRSLSLDAETQSVILKKTDTKTGEVLEQYPTDSQLVLREYSRTQVPNQAVLNAEA